MPNQFSLDTQQPIEQRMAAANDHASQQPPSWSRDRLKRIPYQKHTERGRTYMALKMPGGKWVAQDHFEEVWQLFWRSVHLLRATRKHTTKQLCNDPTWEGRPHGQCRAFGRCMMYFATHGVVPITLANAGKSGSRKYLLNEYLSPASMGH